MSMHFPKQLGTAQPLADPELQFRGPHGERGAPAYNGGVWGRSPQRGPGAEPPPPWSGGQGS